MLEMKKSKKNFLESFRIDHREDRISKLEIKLRNWNNPRRKIKEFVTTK